jgi:hypothetical protein
MSSLSLIFCILKETYGTLNLACIIYKTVVTPLIFLTCVDKYLCSPRGVEHYEVFNMKCNLLRVRNTYLNLILLTWKIWRAPNNASKWQMGFNSAFKGLNVFPYHRVQHTFYTYCPLVFSVILLLQLITF